METRNLDNWKFYLKDITSPSSYIEMGFYYMIAAALQRRVWMGPELKPIFPNMYVILVGPRGVGKGLVIKDVAEILRYHKLKKYVISETEGEATSEPAQDKTKGMPETPSLIPVAADCTTFEELVRYMSQNPRRINTKITSTLAPQGIYSHCSLCFALEEISSIFHKHSQNVAKFLLNAFDCGDYEYRTKHQGIDTVKKMCLSFFGGTTPEFMQETFDDRLLSDGFASRTIFVYADSNRFEKFEIEPFSEEQLAARKTIIDHIKKLTTIFGPVSWSPDALAYMSNYFEKLFPIERRTHHSKLDAYFSRKNIHSRKLAMAMHFADQTENMEISLTTAQATLEKMKELEDRMHLALQWGDKNPLATLANKIYNKLAKEGPQSWIELFREFYSQGKEYEIRESLEFLCKTEKVELKDVPSQLRQGTSIKKYALKVR